MSRSESRSREDLVLEKLEFSPTCDALVTWILPLCLGWRLQLTPKRRCRRPASWIGQYPCCGQHVLACDTHIDPREDAPHCGRRWKVEHLTWSRA